MVFDAVAMGISTAYLAAQTSNPTLCIKLLLCDARMAFLIYLFIFPLEHTEYPDSRACY